jgi:hypothetical protein
MARRRLPRPRPPFDSGPDDLDPGAPEPTARPQNAARELLEGEEEKLVPGTNVGGAAPTALGLDSGGDLPGPDDDLASLSEPEPPEPPEVGAVHIREDEGPRAEHASGTDEEE